MRQLDDSAPAGVAIVAVLLASPAVTQNWDGESICPDNTPAEFGSYIQCLTPV